MFRAVVAKGQCPEPPLNSCRVTCDSSIFQREHLDKEALPSQQIKVEQC